VTGVVGPCVGETETEAAKTGGGKGGNSGDFAVLTRDGF
jgi:hypothetical protein